MVLLIKNITKNFSESTKPNYCLIITRADENTFSKTKKNIYLQMENPKIQMTK